MPEQKKIGVLYMEDDRGLARLTERVMDREGIAIDIAYNGEEGLKKCQEKRYDLILVDYRMPGMTGLDVIKKITQWDDPPPVIMVTGGGSEKTAVEAMKLGASDYIVKDIESGYLNLVPMVIDQVIRRHRLMQEKREAEEAREQLIKELDAFAHTVAHDLKTPLFSVQINVDRLREIKKMSESEASALVDHLDASFLKMGNIIDELLLLATVRQEEVELEILDMNVIVQNAIHRLDYMIQDYQANIEVADNLPAALGHAGWVEEVWTNYLSNAIKYGGVPPKISIGSTWLAGEYVKFWVKDNGYGLSEDERSQVFVPFKRLDSVKTDGHGLGLSIVQRIVHKLYGETDVESVIGEGSTFSFTLPKA